MLRRPQQLRPVLQSYAIPFFIQRTLRAAGYQLGKWLSHSFLTLGNAYEAKDTFPVCLSADLKSLSKVRVGMTIHVLVVDDHTVVRKGLRQFMEDEPEVEIVGEASDGAQAVRLAREL